MPEKVKNVMQVPRDLWNYVKEGECLFPTPTLGQPFNVEYWAKKTNAIMQRLYATADERAFIILAALGIEFVVDDTLSVWMPRYAALNQHQDFSFSVKLELLDAMALVPRFLIRASHCVRQIRNEFAHKLNLENLAGTDPKRLQTLRALMCEIFPKESVDVSPIRMQLTALVFTLFAGFIAYRENLFFLREDIQTEDYMKRLSTQVLQKTKNPFKVP